MRLSRRIPLLKQAGDIHSESPTRDLTARNHADALHNTTDATAMSTSKTHRASMMVDRCGACVHSITIATNLWGLGRLLRDLSDRAPSGL
jgi:hypothetical protein